MSNPLSTTCICQEPCNTFSLYGPCSPPTFVRCPSNDYICCLSTDFCPENPAAGCIFKQPNESCPSHHPYHCFLFFCCESQTYCPLRTEDRRGICDDGNGISTAIGCFSVNNIEEFIESLFRISITVAGGIALLLIIIAAFRVITSKGDSGQVKTGQEGITAAVSGLLFILFAVFILRLLGGDILRLPSFGTSFQSGNDPGCPPGCLYCIADPDEGVVCYCDLTIPTCSVATTPTPTPTPAPCFDYDGGISIYKQGYVEGISPSCETRLTDYCLDSNRLVEYYCFEDQCVSQEINCGLSCFDGSCLSM